MLLLGLVCSIFKMNTDMMGLVDFLLASGILNKKCTLCIHQLNWA